jgi:hypothetical protein
MKVLSILAVTLIATSAHAALPQSTDPVSDAQCAAVFTAVSIKLEKVSAPASQNLKYLSNSYMDMSRKVMFKGADGIYNSQMNIIRNTFAANPKNGADLVDELFDQCKPSVKAYGFVK